MAVASKVCSDKRRLVSDADCCRDGNLIVAEMRKGEEGGLRLVIVGGDNFVKLFIRWSLS